ncbi:aspartate 1-decarboxylase [Candidatus Marinamargulisbacteria bacterium SCGC AAA071-K20]|nr:aspartate 1-decarboxylase [Candidatus Marinamargulisbacteria bacterium SCGC AAA071-K20]
MLITLLKSKITYATIDDSNLYYEGSVTIDKDIMEKVNIKVNEEVQILNINNGERFTTYCICGERGSKKFVLNGPAARRGCHGDQIMILSFAQIDPEKESLEPIVLDMRK